MNDLERFLPFRDWLESRYKQDIIKSIIDEDIEDAIVAWNLLQKQMLRVPQISFLSLLKTYFTRKTRYFHKRKKVVGPALLNVMDYLTYRDLTHAFTMYGTPIHIKRENGVYPEVEGKPALRWTCF